MTSQNRYAEIDLLRALSIIGMIIFHTFFILNYFEVLFQDMNHGAWAIFGNIVRFSFLGLVGISLVLSRNKRTNARTFIRRQVFRALKVCTMALIVSLSTYLVVGDHFVRFGILHLIALGIFIGSFFAGQKYLSLVLAVLILLSTPSIAGLSAHSLFFYILGSDADITATLDYFPVFPWIAVIFVGISLGHFIYPHGKRPTIFMNVPINNFFMFLSKHSLSVYLLHVPIILGLLLLLKILPLTKILAISESLANIV